jgi:transcription antitermination factor NusG
MIPWYVIKSKSQKEGLLWEQLCLRGVETYYPRIRVKTVNPRARKVKPYFPGYLFVQMDLKQTDLAGLRWLPGAVGLVSFHGEPANVPDSIVRAIQKRVDEINATGGEHLEGLKPGDVVTIHAGPLAGSEAIFDRRLSGPDRVRVLLNLLKNRQIPVDIPAGQIERKNRH